jgi:5-methylcytosine-specific restriction endonuclease McrA
MASGPEGVVSGGVVVAAGSAWRCTYCNIDGMDKQCTKCGHVGPLNDFPRDRSRPDGRFPRCKSCNSRNARRWVDKHPERAAEYQRRYREENAIQKREYDRTYSRQRYRKLREENPEVWRCYVRLRRSRSGPTPGPAAIVARVQECGGRCVYCGGPYEHLDHVVALARGGSSDIRNLVPACGPCNRSKGTKPWRSWLAARPDGGPVRIELLDRLIVRGECDVDHDRGLTGLDHGGRESQDLPSE